MDIAGSASDKAQSFLFVNESSDLPPRRTGHSHDIRSHVRRRTVRQVKNLRKKVETERKLVPRVARDLEHSTSELMLRRHNFQLDCSERTGTNLHLTEKSFDELQGTDNSMLRDASRSCGAQLHSLNHVSKLFQKEHGCMTEHAARLPLELNPVEILGAGRADPFLSYPLDNPGRYLHEMIDLVVTYVIPGLIPDDEISHPPRVNSVAKAWMSAGMRTPLLFHAMVFAGIIYHDSMRRSQSFFNSPLALSHKLIVIQRIQGEVLKGGQDATRDEVLLALVILTIHDIENVVEEVKKLPSKSPLDKAQWLNLYGKIQEVKTLTKAVGDSLTLRGGLKGIRLPGLLRLLTGRDLIPGVHSVSKPNVPLIIHAECIDSARIWARGRTKSVLHDPLAISLTLAFERFARFGITDDMLEVLDSMGHIAMAIDYHVQGIPGSLPLGTLIITRDFGQKLVMLLPTAKELELDGSSSSTPNIYECCRLAAMIFSVAAVWPVSNSSNILHSLVKHLKAAIEVSRLESNDDCSDIFLWILVLGGIAAFDELERPWFVFQLTLLAERSKERLEWEEVEKKLKTFLWLESACSGDGQRLWDDVLNLQYCRTFSD